MREPAPRVLGSLIRRYRDFDAAEDAVQEALILAATRWPRDGVPEAPEGWLVRSASRRMVDAWRSERSRRAREERAVREEPTPVELGGEDDTLALLFMCCHPSLTPASAIPLTLRAVGGLTTAEIARAFFVPGPTMAQRISRAKERIRSSGVPFAMPAADQRSARLSNVLRVLYLIFNEGYTSTFGDDLQRTDLSDEAIRLTRMLSRLVPEEAEVAGLLALMLLTDARRAARTDAHGELVPLPEQDRSRWDRRRIVEGLALLEGVVRQRSAGEYALQASIAAIHDQALRPEDTDWAQIEALYAVLERVTANPVVTVNRAVAAAMAYGPAAGLALLDPIDDRLADYHRLHAVRAQLLEMADDPEGALSHYRMAVNRTTSLPEKRFLAARAARLRDAARRSGG